MLTSGFSGSQICRVAVLLTASFSLSGHAVGQDADTSNKSESNAKKVDAGLLASVKFREIGPALTSGRIADLAIDPDHPNVWYAAAGSGNLWKTENAGTTWKPIFDSYGSYSIGCVTIDPNNSNVIWVGTGENVGGRHCGYGDGVYLSRDGGQSFQNMGLKSSEHIAKIIVHPDDSDTVYVASQGPLWSAGGERGLFRTTDGGKSWENILSKGEYTGVTDLVMDPRDPQTLYAATHQRHRTVWALVNGGPETGIHKSTDGGATWKELTQGIPGGDKGKIALGISAVRPDVVYASIELPGREGGFWRSTDRGESWSKQSDAISGGTGPHYYQEIYVDPHRFDVIYQADVRLSRTEDGGKNFAVIEGNNKHVDNHAVAFHPQDKNFLLVGCDGGIYKSYDRGETYAYVANLPLTQFYKISVDNDLPFYNVVGGTQDNFTQYGPTATGNRAGIRNSDWRVTIGGDGHDCAIDPEDPNTIYCESQQGFLRRYDRRTGESVDIRPRPGPGEDALRFNWDSPIHISPHSHTRLYFGSKKLHRSDNRGDSWTAVSGDLSRNLDRYKLKVMDRVWSIDATYDLYAMSQYGNITSISESPLVEGLIYVGTDDGLIQVTEDGGENWRKVDRIFGVPEYFFVNDIKADRFDENTVYACVDDHKTGDYSPYVIKSTDRGRTWTSIVGDLPERHLCWRLEQDHKEANLLFLATEFGVFSTLDGGASWHKLSGIPNIPIRDLEVQRRENDLVAGSFGRGIFVLDDYTPLRELCRDGLGEADFRVFPIKDARVYVRANPLGGGDGIGFQGDSFYRAPNPPFGAVVTYYLAEGLQSKESQRKEKESKVAEKEGDQEIPTTEQLRAEQREEGPEVRYTVKDAQGQVVARGTAAATSGLHRMTWGLEHSTLGTGGYSPYVLPGAYTIAFSKRVEDQETPLGEETSFRVVTLDGKDTPDEKLAAALAFQKEAVKLYQTVSATSARLDESLEDVTSMKDAIRAAAASQELLNEARTLEHELMDLKLKLAGDDIRDSRDQTSEPGIDSRLSNALFGSFRTTSGVTTTQREQYQIAAEAFGPVLKSAQSLFRERLPQLREKLDAAGVPWTRGRAIPAPPR